MCTFRSTQHGLNRCQGHEAHGTHSTHKWPCKPSIQEGTGGMLWAARQHKLSTINLHNRPPPLSIPLCRFQGWGRCQRGGWWWRTGHTVSHLALLAIYLVKSSEAPAVHPTDGFLDWLESSESSEHFGDLHFGLNQACESWKMLVLARGEAMWTLKNSHQEWHFLLK